MFFRKNNVYSAANKKEVNPMKKEMKKEMKNDKNNSGRPTAPQNSAELEAAEELSPLQYTTLVKKKKRNKQ